MIDGSKSTVDDFRLQTSLTVDNISTIGFERLTVDKKQNISGLRIRQVRLQRGLE